MVAFNYAQAPYPIRQDMPDAYRAIWQMLSKPGNWWAAEDRLAIATESRNARECALCAQRKAALSPFAIDGSHRTSTNLPDVAVDAVHRLTTDPSRLTRAWLESTYVAGMTDAKYVELLGIVVAVISIDAFHRALGLPLEPLPPPQPGDPDGYRPPGAKESGAWVPTIQPADLTAAEADLYGGGTRTGNVLAAMSLVPDAVRMLMTLSSVQYLIDVPDPLANGNRALNRPQIELLAGRVSSLSNCFY